MLGRNICIPSACSPQTSSKNWSFTCARCCTAPLERIQSCSHTHTNMHIQREQRWHSAVNLLFLSLCRRELKVDLGGRERRAQSVQSVLSYRAAQGRGVGAGGRGEWSEEERKDREGGYSCCMSDSNVTQQYVWRMSKHSLNLSIAFLGIT